MLRGRSRLWRRSGKSSEFAQVPNFQALKLRACARQTEVRLDVWCEGGFGQQKIDGGGCATISKR